MFGDRNNFVVTILRALTFLKMIGNFKDNDNVLGN